MVHKHPFGAILGIGNGDGSAVCTQEGCCIRFMVQESTIMPQTDITFPQWNGTLWVTTPGGRVLANSK